MEEDAYMRNMKSLLEERSQIRSKVEQILRKNDATLEEKRYALYNGAFGMGDASSLQDGDREVWSVYLDKISDKTVEEHYQSFHAKRRSFLTHDELAPIWTSAKRVYEKHCKEISSHKKH
ncbi:hypothetical protein KW805_02915 [Candidatus Pacearchaeota archaeon]|nr:hypothetical protein [Candidatus Pacearchaeota archaeon]